GPHTEVERMLQDMGARGAGDRRRGVGGSVVDNEDIAVERLHGTAYDVADGRLFVQGGDADESLAVSQGSLLLRGQRRISVGDANAGERTEQRGTIGGWTRRPSSRRSPRSSSATATSHGWSGASKPCWRPPAWSQTSSSSTTVAPTVVSSACDHSMGSR